MSARRLPGTAVRVRRGQRRDLACVRVMLGMDDAPDRERQLRRQLDDLGSDVYVAEAEGGEIVGVVAIAYLRSLRQGRWSAVLDAARSPGEAGAPLLDQLIAFAEERARKRGCRRLSAWIEPDDGALRAALTSRGYHAGEVMTAELGLVEGL
ncbi:MAG TPA: GNAT family N-acetyltransferase [Candidatus Binatia bacterium]|nr:GNAT family N-acetyltransferase [Candidatus Binatia bacterium]